MTPTDTQLKQALAKMLPGEVELKFNNHYFTEYLWNIKRGWMVYDTELLHLCWLVEETLTVDQSAQYARHIFMFHASWQHRTIALAKVKGIEL